MTVNGFLLLWRNVLRRLGRVTLGGFGFWLIMHCLRRADLLIDGQCSGGRCLCRGFCLMWIAFEGKWLRRAVVIGDECMHCACMADCCMGALQFAWRPGGTFGTEFSG